MAIGSFLGLTLCWALERYKFIKLPGDVYFIDSLPVRVEVGDVIAIEAAVLLLCVVATLLPAWWPRDSIRWRRSAMTSEPIVRARGIEKDFASPGQILHVLRGVDLDVTPGEIHVILGASGVGKSTLLHIVGTLDKPTRGSVDFAEGNVFDLSDAARAGFRNRHIGSSSSSTTCFRVQRAGKRDDAG